MCTRPIWIWKPEYRNTTEQEFHELTGYVRSKCNSDFLRNFKMQVPCGHCEDCANRKQHDFFFRAFYEFQRCNDLHGYTLFCTFTFSDEHIPHHGYVRHFDKLLVQDFLHALNMTARRKFHLLVRYVWVSELGGLTHRPHHHALLYFYNYKDNPDNPRQPLLLPTENTRKTLCDLIDLVRQSWRYGINDVKETTAGGVNYVCKYVGKDVCNVDPLESYVNKLREAGYRKHFNAPARLKLFRRTLNRWFHRFGCFSLLSQGVGVSYEPNVTDKVLVQRPVGFVTGYTYALPRYYVDRHNRRTLKQNECEKICEIPVTSRLSARREMFHEEHLLEDSQRAYNRLPDDLKSAYSDTLEDLGDGCVQTPWHDDVLHDVQRIERIRKSKGREKVKRKREQDKIDHKASLVQRGGYALLNAYKGFEALRRKS